MDTIEKQVSIFMNGSEFGDESIKRTMTEELRNRLLSAYSEDRPLKVYCGYDVTAPDIHLGHTITMRKLRQFQEFGHHVTFLIGTFTTLIGDPSDREHERATVLPESIRKNAETYAEQAFKILDKEKTSVRYNHEWLGELKFADILNLSSYFTVQQFLSRDRLRKRIDNNEPLWLRELFYPLAQGYDSVMLQSDVQIGATEQLFNLMAGRKLQEIYGRKPQICITFPVLTGTDGVKRMSKSQGNYIGINEPPEEQYGKIMKLPDELIFHYFTLVTRWSPEQIIALQKDVGEGREHPMEAKKKLAREIVDSLHGQRSADAAERHFSRVHQSGEFPDEMPVFLMNNPVNIVDLLVETGLCKSKSEARRSLRERSIRLKGEVITEADVIINAGNAVLQKGRRNFRRLTTG